MKHARFGALLAAALIAVTPLATTVPSQAATSPLQFGKWVADIPGDDLPRNNYKLNLETIVVRNTGTKAIAMAGYSVKDVQNHTFVFPKGFTLKAGKSVTIHVGKGTNTASHLYWKQGNYVWNNTGDTATLRNAKGSKLDSCTYKRVKAGTKTC